MFFLITHNFKNPDRDYAGFFDILEKYSIHIQVMSNVWIIQTNENANIIASKLQEKIKEEDTLLVIEVKPGQGLAGWVPSNIVNWFNTMYK